MPAPNCFSDGTSFIAFNLAVLNGRSRPSAGGTSSTADSMHTATIGTHLRIGPPSGSWNQIPVHLPVGGPRPRRTAVRIPEPLLPHTRLAAQASRDGT
jgi:hypothetical protein